MTSKELAAIAAEAYERGFRQGYRQGHKDGFEDQSKDDQYICDEVIITRNGIVGCRES